MVFKWGSSFLQNAQLQLERESIFSHPVSEWKKSNTILFQPSDVIPQVWLELVRGVKKVCSALHHRISNHLKRKRCWKTFLTPFTLVSTAQLFIFLSTTHKKSCQFVVRHWWADPLVDVVLLMLLNCPSYMLRLMCRTITAQKVYFTYRFKTSFVYCSLKSASSPYNFKHLNNGGSTQHNKTDSNCEIFYRRNKCIEASQ